jgi:hypothetical protein
LVKNKEGQGKKDMKIRIYECQGKQWLVKLSRQSDQLPVCGHGMKPKKKKIPIGSSVKDVPGIPVSKFLAPQRMSPNSANTYSQPSLSVVSIDIFRYFDSQILISKIRYPTQIPAIMSPHPETFHIPGIVYRFLVSIIFTGLK